MQNQKLERKTSLCIVHTEMGNGVDFMMNTWHGKAPNDEQLENALAQNYNLEVN
jgi:transketolase